MNCIVQFTLRALLWLTKVRANTNFFEPQVAGCCGYYCSCNYNYCYFLERTADSVGFSNLERLVAVVFRCCSCWGQTDCKCYAARCLVDCSLFGGNRSDSLDR